MGLYEYVDENPLIGLDPLGKQGHKLKKCCGDKTYEDNAGNKNKYGCCNNKLYTVKDNCCKNGQIVAKVPIWITRVPNFENDYVRDIAGGWDTVCPLSAPVGTCFMR